MSLFRRFSMVFQQKANRVLDKAENPAEALDLSYEKMLENLQKVRRSIADVLTSQKRLEAQRDTLQQQLGGLEGHARLALQQGNEDVARTALSRAQLLRGRSRASTPRSSLSASRSSSSRWSGRSCAPRSTPSAGSARR